MQRHPSIALTLLGLVIALGTEAVLAQQTSFFPFTTPDGKSGYIDASGQIVIPAQFDAAGMFHDGLAWVRKGSKTGYIDTTGKQVIDLSFEQADHFSEGLAGVGAEASPSKAKHGFIDRTGRVVVPPQYDDVGRFSEGLAAVRTGSSIRYVDHDGRVVIDRGDRLLPFEESWPLVDAPRQFSEGLAPFMEISHTFGCAGWPGEHEPGMQIATESASSPEGRKLEKKCKALFGSRWELLPKWGYIDKSGKVVIPAHFDLADRFSDGLARVKLDGEQAYIDRTGAVVLRPKADRDASGRWKIRPFSQGLAGVKMESRCGFIDKKGDWAVPPRYDAVGSFVGNRAWIVVGNGVGYIDRTGSVIVTPHFVASSDVMFGGRYSREYGGQYFGGDYSDGLASVLTRRGCWGYINTEGQFVWRFAGRAGEVPCVEPASTPAVPPG